MTMSLDDNLASMPPPPPPPVMNQATTSVGSNLEVFRKLECTVVTALNAMCHLLTLIQTYMLHDIVLLYLFPRPMQCFCYTCNVFSVFCSLGVLMVICMGMPNHVICLFCMKKVGSQTMLLSW